MQIYEFSNYNPDVNSPILLEVSNWDLKDWITGTFK